MRRGGPTTVLRPTFGAATEIALEQSQAQVRELEEQAEKLQSEVRKLQRVVADQQQVMSECVRALLR